MYKLFAAFAAFVALWLGFAANAGAALVVGNAAGQVVTAYNVNVDGALYDVSFRTDYCDQIFTPCAAGGFTFNTGASALAAAQALESQVFIDAGPGRQFDSVSGNPDGYTVPFGIAFSSIIGSDRVEYVDFLNFSGASADVFDVQEAGVGSVRGARDERAVQPCAHLCGVQRALHRPRAIDDCPGRDRVAGHAAPAA